MAAQVIKAGTKLQHWLMPGNTLTFTVATGAFVSMERYRDEPILDGRDDKLAVTAKLSPGAQVIGPYIQKQWIVLEPSKSSITVTETDTISYSSPPITSGSLPPDVSDVQDFIDYSTTALTTGLQALKLAAVRRVDVLGVFDSNGLQGGYGWDHGIQKRLSERYGMYATGLISAREASGSGSGVGLGYNWTTNVGASTGAPTNLHNAMSGDLVPNNYSYLSASTAVSGPGLIMNNTCPLSVNLALRAHYCYGTFGTGTGSFKPGARLGVTPFTVLGLGATFDTSVAESVGLTYVNIPAGVRDTNLEFRFAIQGQTGITAPFIGYYVRVENPAAYSGISMHEFYSLGGMSLYDMALAARTAPNDTVYRILYEARRLQLQAGQKPVLVFIVNSGMNDRNETLQPSLGYAGSTTADSAAAYVDNLSALVARIEAVYQANNWPTDELFWVIMPSHPISTPDDAELVSYRSAAQAWCARRQHTSFVDISTYVDSATMLANGWYNSAGADPIHMTQAGYEGVAALIF